MKNVMVALFLFGFGWFKLDKDAPDVEIIVEETQSVDANGWVTDNVKFKKLILRGGGKKKVAPLASAVIRG